MLAYSLSSEHSHILVSLAAREAVPVRIWHLFSLGLFHEIANRLSCMQHIHVHTPSYSLWGPVPDPLTYFKPFHSFQCPQINQKKFKVGKGSQIAPSHLPRRQLASTAALLPDSGIFSALPYLSLAAREAVPVRIWYYCFQIFPFWRPFSKVIVFSRFHVDAR